MRYKVKKCTQYFKWSKSFEAFHRQFLQCFNFYYFQKWKGLIFHNYKLILNSFNSQQCICCGLEKLFLSKE